MASAVAERYAGALFELAEEKRARNEIAQGLAQVREALATDADARKKLFDRRTEVAEKRKLIQDRIAKSAHPLVKNVLCLLVDRHRENEILEVALAFFERVEEAEGILRVEIESAQPLDAETQGRLVNGLSQATKCKVSATTTVQPELLGGIRLVIGSRRLDGSVKRKIEKLAERLRTVV